MLRCRDLLFCFVLIGCLTAAFETRAQSPPAESWFAELTPSVHHFKADDNLTEQRRSIEQLENFLSNYFSFLDNSLVGLQLIKSTESKTAWHASFQQTINGKRIRGATVRLSLSKTDHSVRCTERLVDPKTIALDINRNQAAVRTPHTARLLVEKNLPISEAAFDREPHWVLLTDRDAARAIWAVHYRTLDPVTGAAFDYHLDETGGILRVQDAATYYRNRGGCCHGKGCSRAQLPPDSLATFAVFEPDPLTTAGADYGGAYVDDNDADSPQLNAERKNRQERVDFSGGVFSLDNDRLVIADNFAPAVDPVALTTPNFIFQRSQPGFEDAMVFYHINRFYDHLDQLGYGDLDDKISADAHSLNGQDQSRFFANSLGQLFLDFGEGGVDDAEDADVIVHEYIHALSYMANASNVGTERRAIDEALGDYFATTYSRSFDDFRWEDMFTWDGHNEFWSGRDVNADLVYPDDAGGSDFYRTSQIVSSALMDMYDEMGRDRLDELVLEWLFYLTENMSLQQASEALLFVERELYGGEFQTVVWEKLFLRGLVSDLPIEAGRDTTICLGDRVELGGAAFDLPILEPNWSGGEAILDAETFNASVSPSQTTTYVLQVRNTQTDQIYADSVRVAVEYCSDLTDDIILVNAANFASGLGDLFIQLSEETTYCDLQVYDLYGRLHATFFQRSDEPVRVPARNLIPGVYVVSVESNKGNEAFKVFKSR